MRITHGIFRYKKLNCLQWKENNLVLHLINQQTRKHSSRMRTVRLLTGGAVLGVGMPSILSRWVLAWGGIGAVHNRKWHHDTPPWTEWLTDRCKNITFPTSFARLRVVTIRVKCWLPQSVYLDNFPSQYPQPKTISFPLLHLLHLYEQKEKDWNQTKMISPNYSGTVLPLHGYSSSLLALMPVFRAVGWRSNWRSTPCSRIL